VTIYRNVDSRALGIEAMIRRDLGRSVTGWLSYSLGEVDRDLGFTRLPGDFDQRHTLNATAQWRHGSWRFGATGHLHTGRPVPYRLIAACSSANVSAVSYPLLARRPPLGWRIDLRIERALQVARSQLRVYVELQNASFTRETLSYDGGRLCVTARAVPPGRGRGGAGRLWRAVLRRPDLALSGSGSREAPS